MRYGYATIALPTLDPEEACAALARAGFTGVEWALGTAPHAAGSSAEGFMLGNRCRLAAEPAAVAAAAAAARRHGLEVIGLAPYLLPGDFAWLDVLIGLAAVAGTRQLRIQPPRRTAGSDARILRAEFAAFLHAAVPLIRAHDVTLAVEVHQLTVAPSVGLALPLIDGLDPERVGVIYDIGNLVVEGYEDDALALELLGPYLHHVHLKNARLERAPDGRRHHEWSALQDGVADVGGLLELLEERDYRGWVSIEDLSDDSDSAASIARNAAALSDLAAPGWAPASLPHEQDPRHAD